MLDTHTHTCKTYMYTKWHNKHVRMYEYVCMHVWAPLWVSLCVRVRVRVVLYKCM